MGETKQEHERLLAAIQRADRALVQALDARASATIALHELSTREPDVYFRMPSDRDTILHAEETAQRFPGLALRAVMIEVLSGCAALVAPINVAYLGHEGGFEHLAARRHFGASANLRPAEDAASVLSEIDSGRCAFGVLPFESTYDGAVTATLNALARGDTKISAEMWVSRAFHLLSKSGELAAVRRVYGASDALGDCGRFLARTLSAAETVDVRNGVLAARRAEQDPEAAAIATEVVSELADLQFVERHVEDDTDLRTRFVVVGHDYPARTGHDRTAVAIAFHGSRDGMARCVQPFSERSIGLHRLETRPARGWEFRYLILIEVDGHVTDRPVLAAIDDLRAQGAYIRVLGSFPRVDEP